VNLFEISFKHLRVLPNEIAKMLVDFRLIHSFLVESFLERVLKEIRHLNNCASDCYPTNIDREEEFVSASDGVATVLCQFDALRLAHVKPRDAIKLAESGRSFPALEKTGLI
jgi:hypothetical protein